MNPMTPQAQVAAILATDLTQAQLASIVPCSQTSISSLLTGKRGNRISKTLGDRIEAIYVERCILNRAPRKASPAPP